MGGGSTTRSNHFFCYFLATTWEGGSEGTGVKEGEHRIHHLPLLLSRKKRAGWFWRYRIPVLAQYKEQGTATNPTQHPLFGESAVCGAR